MNSSAVAFAFLIGTIVKTLDYIYLFQIKEYRLDRFLSALHDSGYVRIFLSRQKLPAKKTRNLIIFVIALALLALLTFAVQGNTLLLLPSVLLLIPAAFTATYTGVLVSSVFALLKRRAIVERAKRHLERTRTIVIGITGSYGKTTTKENLYEMLSRKFSTARTDGNFNTDVGVALSILKNVKKDTRYFIAEMGAYRRGEIEKICSFTNPAFGILTGIGNQHLDLFGSRENLIHAKKELLEALPANGRAYVNAECAVRNMLEEGVKAPIEFFRDSGPVLDVAAPVALARHLGVGEEEIETAMKTIRKRALPVTTEGYRGTVVIDNSYNTSREGFLHTIRTLAGFKKNTRIIASRGIPELGTEKQETYALIAGALARERVILYTTDHAFSPSPRIRIFDAETGVQSALLKEAGPETAVAFEGRFDKQIINRFKRL